MNLQSLIQTKQKKFSDLDWSILGYILENEAKVAQLNIVDLEKEVHSSKSSILRLTKKLGFSGYTDFKYFLREGQKTVTPSAIENLLELQTLDINNTIKLARQTDFSPLMKAIEKANTIYCYGTGYSQRKVIEEFSKLLMLCGKRALVIPVKTELDISMSMITKDDLVVFTSLSGETPSIKENILSLNARKIPVVTLTTFSHNFFAEHAQYAYFFYATPFDILTKDHDATSLVGLSVLVDIIFRAFVSHLNDQNKQP